MTRKTIWTVVGVLLLPALRPALASEYCEDLRPNQAKVTECEKAQKEKCKSLKKYADRTRCKEEVVAEFKASDPCFSDEWAAIRKKLKKWRYACTGAERTHGSSWPRNKKLYNDEKVHDAVEQITIV